MTRHPRRRAALGAAALALALASVLAPGGAVGSPAVAAGAGSSTLSFPGLSAAGAGGSAVLDVPPGTRPERLRGRLTDTSGTASRVQVVVGGRVATTARVPSSGHASVDVAVSAADEADGSVTVRLAAVQGGSTAARCDLVPAPVTLDDLRLTVGGQETAPATVAAFLPSRATRVDVVVPPSAPSDVVAAGLAAVGALSHRYDAGTPVDLTTTTPTSASPGTRVVALAEGSGDVTAVVDPGAAVPTLTLTGAGSALQRAATALGSSVTSLANAGKATGLSLTGSVPAPLDRTLADLGTARVTLSGYGTSSSFVGVNQADFGGPVSALELHVSGTHTALVAGTDATLDIRFNDFLVASLDLSGSRAIDTDVRVPSSMLQSSNGLSFQLDASPPQRFCQGPLTAIPIEVDLDGGATSLSATRGNGPVTGFQRFPQVLAGTLPVALRGSGADLVRNAELAAPVVASLQRATRDQLTVESVSPGDLLGGGSSGLLVGATGDDSNAVSAPLRLFGMRLMYFVKQQGAVGTDQPYAALEAVHSGGRDLLLLGGWSPSGSPAPALGRHLATHVSRSGWADLSDDVLLSSAGTPVFGVSSNAVYPQEQRVSDTDHFAWWLAGAIVLLLLVLAVRWAVVRARRRRIAELVDAEQRADEGPEHDAEQDPGSDDDVGDPPPSP